MADVFHPGEMAIIRALRTVRAELRGTNCLILTDRCLRNVRGEGESLLRYWWKRWSDYGYVVRCCDGTVRFGSEYCFVRRPPRGSWDDIERLTGWHPNRELIDGDARTATQ